MVKSRIRGRSFDGKSFSSFVSIKKKRDAKETAERLRRRGDAVRVVPTNGRFEVFTSKGRRRKR